MAGSLVTKSPSARIPPITLKAFADELLMECDNKKAELIELSEKGQFDTVTTKLLEDLGTVRAKVNELIDRTKKMEFHDEVNTLGLSALMKGLRELSALQEKIRLSVINGDYDA